MKHTIYYLVALGLGGCGHAPANDQPAVLLSSSFETVEGWLPDEQAATLSHEQAHSGHTALKVDDNHTYSLTYCKTLRELQLTSPATLRVKAWALCSDVQAQASLVVSVADSAMPGSPPLLWQGIKLSGTTSKPGQWTPISQLVQLPTTLSGSHKLSLYLWQTKPGPAVYLDDIQLVRQL